MHRILFVSATRHLGGAERSLVELARELDRERYEPHAVVAGDGALAEALRARGVSVEHAPMVRIHRTVNPVKIAEYIAAISKASRRIAEIARAKKIDLVHANNDVAQVYAGEAASREGLPCVWHARDMLRLGPLGERLSEKSSRVIAVSDAVRDHILSSGVEVGKIHVVRNGIDLGPYEGLDRPEARAGAREELGLSAEGFVVGTAGVFVPWKRHEDFVRAFEKLCELEIEDHVRPVGSTTLSGRRGSPEGPGGTRVELAGLVPVRGVIFGADLTGDQGRYEFDLKRLADTAVGERILFAGWREDLPRLLPALDVFVSASEGEPFGRVVVEAMAAGRAVVATASGGKAEIVEQDKTGVLVPQGDVSAMAQACHFLQKDAGARSALGEAAREAAFEKFSVARVAREVQQVYAKVLG